MTNLSNLPNRLNKNNLKNQVCVSGNLNGQQTVQEEDSCFRRNDYIAEMGISLSEVFTLNGSSKRIPQIN